MFGGNSNWRGSIWMPVNALLIRALLSFYLYYGDNFKIEWDSSFIVAFESDRYYSSSVSFFQKASRWF